MKYSAIPSAQTVMLYCQSRGIKNIVISPGSRNAPLTISFTENPFFNCFSIVDERSAAFFALGVALQQKTPTVLVCTSGSALLNYYPAIAEAFYSDVPLIVISADRPSYKIDVGDGQTIRQDHVFDRHIGYSANLKLDVCHHPDTIRKFAPQLLEETQGEVQNFNESQILKAFNKALLQRQPVHINIPFEEPLYDTDTKCSLSISIPENEMNVEEVIDYESLANQWNGAKRKMILVGVNHPNEIAQEHLDHLANDPSVVVFTETTSNLHHSNFFPSIDSIIFPIEKSNQKVEKSKELQPDILLTFGGMIVSKKIKAYLREYSPKQHWHIDPIKAFDTYFCLDKHFKMKPNIFLEHFLPKTISTSSTYQLGWQEVKANYKSKRTAYIHKAPFSDYTVFDKVLKGIPEAYQVHLANSSTVRYAQLFDMHPSLKVYCNRGTSGIDGSSSTALGAAFFETEPTLLITGDLSFFYDCNAYWNTYVKSNFRIILINNSGGGIFRILPGANDSENFETYFETAHFRNAENICEQFGIDYTLATNEAQLAAALINFYGQGPKPKLLEVQTPRKLNNKILLGYFDFIS
ncbi:MAG: 2-succinyl-5-enolpyruvyl-6-hydroxy-3-cyclohexene-1-carboxylic-acid synthase [Croceitalea sp.]|nr:2-succinyl-5-enolpyruvyl-6-hydroxy-3-cyclohexene-1-carboxylic-acid synthase [Croceitalea sp.]NNM18936.1 2-succinyl-5-enolpyruvyl-6-hydroxy-3-cyclohexene-1-carboxylic-acid synthase [Croceitalea sp.]